MDLFSVLCVFGLLKEFFVSRLFELCSFLFNIMMCDHGPSGNKLGQLLKKGLADYSLRKKNLSINFYKDQFFLLN
jgi:hypothetical protein